MARIKRCPNCKSEDIDENLAEESICSECGEEFDESDNEDDDKKE